VEDTIDFWDEMSEPDRGAIDEGLEQLDNGHYVSHQAVRDEIIKKFNFNVVTNSYL